MGMSSGFTETVLVGGTFQLYRQHPGNIPGGGYVFQNNETTEGGPDSG